MAHSFVNSFLSIEVNVNVKVFVVGIFTSKMLIVSVEQISEQGGGEYADL